MDCPSIPLDFYRCPIDFHSYASFSINKNIINAHFPMDFPQISPRFPSFSRSFGTTSAISWTSPAPPRPRPQATRPVWSATAAAVSWPPPLRRRRCSTRPWWPSTRWRRRRERGGTWLDGAWDGLDELRLFWTFLFWEGWAGLMIDIDKCLIEHLGGVPESAGYPQLSSSFKRMFHYNPSRWGCPHSRKPPYLMIFRWYLDDLRWYLMSNVNPGLPIILNPLARLQLRHHNFRTNHGLWIRGLMWIWCGLIVLLVRSGMREWSIT